MVLPFLECGSLRAGPVKVPATVASSTAPYPTCHERRVCATFLQQLPLSARKGRAATGSVIVTTRWRWWSEEDNGRSPRQPIDLIL